MGAKNEKKIGRPGQQIKKQIKNVFFWALWLPFEVPGTPNLVKNLILKVFAPLSPPKIFWATRLKIDMAK